MVGRFKLLTVSESQAAVNGFGERFNLMVFLDAEVVGVVFTMLLTGDELLSDLLKGGAELEGLGI